MVSGSDHGSGRGGVEVVAEVVALERSGRWLRRAVEVAVEVT